MDYRKLFLQHVAQTSPKPIGLEIVEAEGIYLKDKEGKRYIDGISGFSVCNIGHSHPDVVKAVQEQAARYMHLIVYGEFIEQPQVAYAKRLTELLPESLNCVYFTNSGAEATEGAMKLSKRITGRSRIISAKHAYHGSTQGALSLMGDEYFKQAFRPLLPETVQYPYNSAELLEAINHQTAAIVIETVQAESGVVAPDKSWLAAVRTRCNETCTLLVLDEIQAGFGRTGSLWAFEQFGIVPDILLLGKALGGGMPLGAFIADQRLMRTLTYEPVLGHISTFGGHPVSCAAGKAALEVLLQHNWIEEAAAKGKYLAAQLQHPSILELNQTGLWISLRLKSAEATIEAAHKCVTGGLITDWFLFAPDRLRLAPPLSISYAALDEIAAIVRQSI